jgi:hypothetical protein
MLSFSIHSFFLSFISPPFVYLFIFVCRLEFGHSQNPTPFSPTLALLKEGVREEETIGQEKDLSRGIMG